MNATSETIGAISAALAKAQGAMAPAMIDGKAQVQMKSGGSFGYTYASLTSVWEAIRKPLSDNGLAVIQRTDDENGVIFLYTILGHESGEYITSRLYVGPAGRGAQETGSALTYARRYGLSAIVGVVTDEDDDGAEATKQQTKKQPASTQRQPETTTNSAGTTVTKTKPATNGKQTQAGDNGDSLPFPNTKRGAVDWAMQHAPQVWPTDKGFIVRSVVERSFDNCMTANTDKRGADLGRAWIAKVNGKIADSQKPPVTEPADDDDGWQDVDNHGHDADDPAKAPF